MPTYFSHSSRVITLVLLYDSQLKTTLCLLVQTTVNVQLLLFQLMVASVTGEFSLLVVQLVEEVCSLAAGSVIILLLSTMERTAWDQSMKQGHAIPFTAQVSLINSIFTYLISIDNQMVTSGKCSKSYFRISRVYHLRLPYMYTFRGVSYPSDVMCPA